MMDLDHLFLLLLHLFTLLTFGNDDEKKLTKILLPRKIGENFDSQKKKLINNNHVEMNVKKALFLDINYILISINLSY